MKKKVIGIVLAVLLISLFLPGCVFKTELEECRTRVVEFERENSELKRQKAELEEQIAELERENSELKEQIAEFERENSELEEQIAEFERENSELKGQKAELEEQIAELQVEIECLREPPPEKVRGEIAGYISYKKTVEVGKKLFTLFGVAGSSRKDYPLNTIETLEQFLANDQTNICPSCRGTCYDAHDGWAFQLKDHWIKAGLSAWSLGLTKVETDTQYGRVLVWRNIFLTQENGEFVFYEVDPCTDKITKIEGSTENYRVTMITDKLWIIN
jgi:cell division protein FtsL